MGLHQEPQQEIRREVRRVRVVERQRLERQLLRQAAERQERLTQAVQRVQAVPAAERDDKRVAEICSNRYCDCRPRHCRICKRATRY